MKKQTKKKRGERVRNKGPITIQPHPSVTYTDDKRDNWLDRLLGPLIVPQPPSLPPLHTHRTGPEKQLNRLKVSAPLKVTAHNDKARWLIDPYRYCRVRFNYFFTSARTFVIYPRAFTVSYTTVLALLWKFLGMSAHTLPRRLHFKYCPLLRFRFAI